MAIDSSQADVTLFLLEHWLRQKIDEIIKEKPDDFTDLLLHSSRRQMWDFLDKLIPNVSGLLLDCQLTRDRHGQTCLHYMAMGGQASLVVRLLRLIQRVGAAPSCIGQEDNCGRTAYWYSAVNGHWPVAAVLLIHGANPSVKSPWPGRLGGSFEVNLSENDDRYKIDLPRLSKAGLFANGASCSILHAVCAMGDTALVKMLCKERPELATTLDGDGRSALFYAAYNGRKVVMQVLLKLDVDWLSIDAAVFNAATIYALKQARHVGLLTTPKGILSSKAKTRLFTHYVSERLAHTTQSLASKEPLFDVESAEAGLNNANDCIALILQSLGKSESLSTPDTHLLCLAAVVIGAPRLYTSLESSGSLVKRLEKHQISTALTTTIGRKPLNQLEDATESSVSLFELALHFLARRITARSSNKTLNHKMARETISLLMPSNNEESGLLTTIASPLLSPTMRTLLQVDPKTPLKCDIQSYMHIFSFALKNTPDCATLLANAIHERPDSDDRDALACVALHEAVYYNADATVQALLKLGQNPSIRLLDKDLALRLVKELPVRHCHPAWTALHVAIARGHSNLFATLWNVAVSFSSPSVVTRSGLWNELLYMSAAYGNDEVRACLTRDGCQYLALTNDVGGLLSRRIDTRSVCLTAVKNGHGPYAETVFNDVASRATAVCDEDKQTNIYHYAACNGLLTLTKYLLEHNVPGFHHADEYGFTPIRYAQEFGHIETLQVLIESSKAAGKTTMLSRLRPHGVLRYMEQHNVSVDRYPTWTSTAELKRDASSFKNVDIQRVACVLAEQRDHMAWAYIQAVQPDLSEKNAQSQTLLHYAAAVGCVNSLTLMLDMAKQHEALNVCIMEDSVGHTGKVYYCYKFTVCTHSRLI